MSKRARVLARGEEEVWKWESFGSTLPEVMSENVYYAHEHQLPRAGVKQGGKVSMIECAKIAFYIEPYPFANIGGYMNHYIRFALSANEFQFYIAKREPFTGGLYNIDEFLDKSNVYWVHTEEEAKNWGEAANTGKGYAHQYPVMYDVSAPDGQGILFRGKHVWTTALTDMENTTKDYAQISYSFYCLVRTVWVTPEFWVTSQIQAGNIGEGGVLV